MKGTEIDKFVYYNKTKMLLLESDSISNALSKEIKTSDINTKSNQYNMINRLNEIIRKDNSDIILVYNFHG